MKANIHIIFSVIFLFTLGKNIKPIEKNIHIEKQVGCDLLPSVRTNSSTSFHMNEIDSSEYNSKTFKAPYKLTLFANSDSIEKIYNEAYPNIFKKTEKGYKFKTIDGRDIVVENNPNQEKSYSKYEFKAKFKDYVIILMTYYEGGEVVLVDIKTGFAFTMIDKPRFITENLVYSFADYYGDADIQIYNIENRKSIELSFSNLSIVDSYNIANHIFFKTVCLESNEKKYFQILCYN